MSFFSETQLIPPDPIFGLGKVYKEDERDDKVDLMVGVYRSDNMQCEAMNVVHSAMKKLSREGEEVNYLPFLGDPQYLTLCGELLFGKERFDEHHPRIVSGQGIGGTGALHIGAKMLSQMGYQRVYLPDPTWANHNKIFSHAGFELKQYPYYDIRNEVLLFDEMIAAFSKMEKGDVVLMHTSCHNPSGYDPSEEQWKIIAKVLKERGVIPFFDTAYQGFGDSLDQDVYAVRLFLDEGLEFISSQSFSKNFALYCERVAAIFFVVNDLEVKERLESNVKVIVRSTYSNPPRFGANLVKTILSDDELRVKWEKELERARVRLGELRQLLARRLEEKIPSRDWAPLAKAKGMFLFCGLEPNQVLRLREEFGIYMTGKGRINVSGLNEGNIDYIVASIQKVID